MGNLSTTPTDEIRAVSKRKKKKALPIETIFKLPSQTPSWPQEQQGQGFGSGTVDLGEIKVRQISTFNRVWASHEGGPENGGATFFEPYPIPDGFHMLGCYAQPNDKPLFGSVLVAESSGDALASPLDYQLAWTSEPSKIKREGNAFFWLPTPPEGYKAVGLAITDSPNKPPVDKLRCVRADLTEPCEGDSWLWGLGNRSALSDGFNVYALRPVQRGLGALGVPVGTFTAHIGPANPVPVSLACLKNASVGPEALYSSMPSLEQIETLFKAYGPVIYFHPDEKYLPSSVSWYFENGASLYHNGEGSVPIRVDKDGSNLPKGGANDGEYWLDLPKDKTENERVKRGNLANTRVYLHAKAILGGTYTDIAIWLFYPFNGPGRAKLGLINISLGKIGEHVGDWEHLTLRISNFSGNLERFYLSQHSKGAWVDAPGIEFFPGTNKPVAYSSLNGHANYPKPGLVLQGNNGVGIRNDTAKGKALLDSGTAFEVVAAEYLSGNTPVLEPNWLNYMRKWGPKIEYDTRAEFQRVEKVLIGALKTTFKKMVNGLPNEVFGEDGPTGPKVKGSWSGDEPYY